MGFRTTLKLEGIVSKRKDPWLPLGTVEDMALASQGENYPNGFTVHITA